MNSRREVILHIGTPKTGTTALQLAFFNSLKYLDEKGVCYPNLTESGFGWTVERGLGSGNANIHSRTPWESNVAEERLAYIVHKAVSQCGPTNSILLSSEVLNGYVASHKFWETITKLSEDLNLSFRMVVYLRDPFKWFIASYQQSVKSSGYFGDLDSYLHPFLNGKSDLSFATQKNLPKILELANKSNCEIEIYRYEESLPSIEKHFFENVLGLDFDSVGILTSKVNTTFNIMELEFHRGINSLSKHLGDLLSFERSDTALAKEIERFDFSDSKFLLSLESRQTLEHVFGEYRESLKQCTNFADLVDYSIDTSRLTLELDETEQKIRKQIFELGRFVAMSYSSGYIKWDWKQQRNVATEVNE